MVNVVETEIKKEEVNMPGGDRTGPAGMGPMTGRRMGLCAGNEQNGNSYGFGRGFVRGFRGNQRGGRGFSFSRHRNAFNKPMADSESQKKVIENELDALKRQISFLQAGLERLSK